jgi:DNA-binding CsgD family transcriptional regulator
MNVRSGSFWQSALEDIVRSNSVQHRFETLVTAFGQLGFDELNYGYFDPAAANTEEAEVLFLSTMDRGWLDYYADRTLHFSDPLVRFVRAGNVAPYLWSADAMKHSDDPDVRSTSMEINEAGLASALMFPMMSASGQMRPIAAVTFGSSLSGDEIAKSTKGLEPYLISMANLFHQRSHGPMVRETLGIRILSPRERDCLSLLARGHRAERIAEHLGLARVTADLHLRQARIKLHARTMPEAVAKALRFGEIFLD